MFENLLAWFVIGGLIATMLMPSKSGARRKSGVDLGEPWMLAVLVILILGLASYGS